MSRAVISGAAISRQAKRFEDVDSLTVMLEAALAALDDAGLTSQDIDGICARWPGPGGTNFHPGAPDWASLLGTTLRWSNDTYPQGVPALLTAAAAIDYGLANVVLIVNGQAGGRGPGGRPAPWTKPSNEFTEPYGATTPAQFALVARAYQLRYGLDEADVAYVSSSIRNNGHRNPEALMYGRGPYTVSSVLESDYYAEPLRLLDICLATEGAAALVLARPEIARDGKNAPVQILSGGMEWLQQQYVNPPTFPAAFRLGGAFADSMFAQAGLERSDVDVFSIYDANSFEIIRQFEALGFCPEGEGGAFIRDQGVFPDGRLNLNTDGGLLSFSHPGFPGPTIKIVEAVKQLRGQAGARQVDRARTALVSGAGSGAQYYNAALLAAD